MKWIRCVDCDTKIITLKGQRQRCNECKRLWSVAYNKAWRLRNKEKLKKLRRSYYLRYRQNPEWVKRQKKWGALSYQRNKVRVREYAKRNRNKIKLRMAAWCKRNKEILKLKRAAHYQQNRSRISAKSREYHRKNRTQVLAKMRVYGKRYYARPEIKQKAYFQIKKNRWLHKMQSVRGFTTQERELNEKRFASRTS